jgi:hypothetical protein
MTTKEYSRVKDEFRKRRNKNDIPLFACRYCDAFVTNGGKSREWLLLSLIFCASVRSPAKLQPIMDVGERYFDTAALFDVQISFQAEHFMASLVVFLPQPKRGDAANSPTSQPSWP